MATRRMALPVFAGLMLAAPVPAMAAQVDAGVAAKRPTPLRSVSAPPDQVVAGRSFDLTARILNSARRDTRPRLVVRLRKHKYGSGGRVLFARKLGKVQAGDVRRYKVAVELPGSLAAGKYWLSVCARTRSGASCERSARRFQVVKPSPSPSPGGGGGGGGGNPDRPRYDVLVLTESASTENAAATAAGARAIEEVSRGEDFKVDVVSDSRGVFTEGSLKSYRTVVFLNTVGDVLTDNEQAAFEDYFKQGGGFLALGSAIGAEPSWAFMTSLLGTRAQGVASVQESATIKVADRVHDASKSLAERFDIVDSFYNTTSDVRGLQHVLATVDEGTYEENDGTAQADDHPVMWCQDLEGGRAFYTGTGHNAATYGNPNVRRHLVGAIKWAAGASNPIYSDCGATVLANYKQVKISAPPNLNEPIGFDQLPDGRIIQTARAGEVRLHDPEGGTTTVLGNVSQFPQGLYTHSEDGLYGPAVDNDFAQNKWVYLYYSPATVKDVPQSDGTRRTITTPTGANIAAPTTAATLDAWDPYVGYFQLSRFKFVEATPGNPAHLDPSSEQEIMRVPVNRGACCHVGGDIEFDADNNLWLVTGDDTPSQGGLSGGFSPHNDSSDKTDEIQTVRVNGNPTGGTFTLTFDGQTTGPIPFNATGPQLQQALEGLSNVEPGDVAVRCGVNPCWTASTLTTTRNEVDDTTMNVIFDGQYRHEDVPQLTATPSLTPAGTVAINTTQVAGHFFAPYVDARRSAMNTNDLRGKVLRIKVNEDGSHTSPSGNLFPESQDAAGETRPEIYAMGFRNPFRIQVDSEGVAHVTDYSPDSQVPQDFRGPAGVGRVEVVRKPSNYGWPLCYSPDLPYYRWNFNLAQPLDATPTPYECGNPSTGAPNESKWNTGELVDATVEPGRTATPPITQPDLWYSYRDNTVPLGTPCFGYYDNEDPTDTCPQLFPELFTGGVGPHGAAAYDFRESNPSETKFPPYYDGATILGEFTQDTMREVRFDSSNRVLEINPFLNCGAALQNTGLPFECDNPMDMQFGSDGNFYLLTYGDGFFTPNADAGMYRWEYTKGPQRPRAVVGATPRNGRAPLTVQFSSEGSRDEDPGDSIRFAWDFQNDGTVDSTDPNPQFTYTANGVYTARLTVTDSTGKTSSASTVITVGNTAPTVTINTPIDGDFFAFGDNIPYQVTVTDSEDTTIDCSRVTVTFVLVHDTHGHADASRTGCTGFLPTDAGDAAHGGYLAGGISASYTDNAQGSIPALTTTTQHVVQLRRHELEFAQDVSGLTGANAEGGRAVSGIDAGDWVALNNRINLTNMAKQITFRFAGGRAGAVAGTTPQMAVEIRSGSPTGALLDTVTLTATGINNNTYADRTVALTGSYNTSQRLYLVFRAAEGGPSTGMGSINWVEFSGPGAGVTP